MFLFKSSGATYRRVARQAVHAFPYSPAEAQGDEFVLLSKNSADCSNSEKQVQHVAKLLDVRAATPEELDQLFPGVTAGARWKYLAKLYEVKLLPKPFNLRDISGFNARRYNPVQGFARLDAEDQSALVRHLCDTNPDLVLHYLNDAVRPKPD